MANKLEVSFNSPQCGWMSIGLANGEREFHTTTAHAPHERALSKLLRILSDLLDKNSERNEYVLEWSRDPEEFDFRFLRNGDKVVLEIYQYPTAERESAFRERVFAHKGKIEEVCAAFYDTFSQLYQDRETDEFELNWRQQFPLKEFNKFHNSMTSRVTAA